MTQLNPPPPFLWPWQQRGCVGPPPRRPRPCDEPPPPPPPVHPPQLSDPPRTLLPPHGGGRAERGHWQATPQDPAALQQVSVMGHFWGPPSPSLRPWGGGLQRPHAPPPPPP